ncbi:MAG: ABC transporter permease [Acidimicrobiales bacterium]|nr:ABC transporter permease [Acidimicrobiales bacterium]
MNGGIAVLIGAGLRSRRRGGLVATFAVLVLAAIALAIGLVVARQGAPLLDAAANDANVAHLVLYGDGDAIADVSREADVVASSGPFDAVGGIELLLSGETVPIEATALDSPDIEVNHPPIRSGRWAMGNDEIVLDYSLSGDLGIDVGDAVTLRLAGAELTFSVVGTAVNFTDCLYPQCEPGRTWVTQAGLARFDAGERIYSVGYLRFDDAASADPFVERQAAAGVAGIEGTNSWLDTRGDFLTIDRVFGAFVAAFGVFVLVVAAVIIAGSTAMRIVTERRNIALMGAIGSTPRQIMAALLLENLVLGAVAGVVGWLVAGFLAPTFQIGIGRTLGPQDPSWSGLGLVVCLGVTVVLLSAATIVSARRAARRPVTEVLRDVPPGRVSWLNRHASRLPGPLSLLGAQEAASQPARSGLAALAIAVAVIGGVVSVGFISAIDLVTSEAERSGDPWDVALIPGSAAPARVEQALDDTPGVDHWFSSVERRSTYRDGAFLSVATGGDPQAAAYRIVEGRPLRAPGEAIVGYGFMQRFDVSVGDRIEFLAGTNPISVDVVGWYRDTEDSGEILRYRVEDLVAADPGVIPEVYSVTVAHGSDPAAVGAALAEAVGPDARSEVLDTGRDDLEPLMFVLRAIVLVLFVTAGVNLLSTLLTASRESAKRIGVEKALGFTPGQLTAQGAVAGTMLGAAAVIAGIPIGLLVFRVLADAVSNGIGVGPGWLPAPGVVQLAIVAALAIGLSAALGALAERRVAIRPAAELVRGE